MRKVMGWLLALAMVCGVAVQASADAGIRVQLDGSEVTFDAAPFVESGRTLVPVRALSESLGFTVGWVEAEQKITLTRGETTISLWVDSTKVLVNDKESALEVPVRKVGSRTFIPLRFVAETLGAHVAWNQETQTAAVTSGKSFGALVAKGLSEPGDQKSEGLFQMVMTLKGDGMPAGGLTIPTNMAISSHVYNNEMLAKVATKPVLGPVTVIEVAAVGGKLLTKAPPATTWVESGTYNPKNIGQVYGMSGIQGLDPAALQKDVLGSSALRVAGTVVVDGLSLVRLELDLSKGGMDGLVKQILASVPGAAEGLAAGEIKMSFDRYLISYLVDPQTGFVYQTGIDMAITMDMRDAKGAGGTMTMTMKGSMAAKPVSEPIQFPADLPR